MWKYKDVILSYHKKKPDFINFKPATSKAPTDTNDTVSRLARKVSPYSEKEFKIIINRAFLSVHIREILIKWEEDPSTPITLTEASNEVIDNLKFEYPKLQKWDISRLLIA